MPVTDSSKTLQMHMPCLLDQYAPQTGFSMLNVLRYIGYEVTYPDGQTCCGLPAHHYGYGDDAKSAGEKLLGEFQGTYKALSASHACSKMVKDSYTDLFNNSLLHNNCKRTQKNFFDFTAFILSDTKFSTSEFINNGRFVYMNFCGSDIPFAQLQEAIFDKIKGLEISSLDGSEGFCCGFGGWFHAYHPDISTRMAEDVLAKMQRFSNVTTIVTSEPGCMVHINNFFKKHQHPYRIIHIADLLAQSIV